jgi:hypothetical protein
VQEASRLAPLVLLCAETSGGFIVCGEEFDPPPLLIPSPETVTVKDVLFRVVFIVKDDSWTFPTLGLETVIDVPDVQDETENAGI